MIWSTFAALQIFEAMCGMEAINPDSLESSDGSC